MQRESGCTQEQAQSLAKLGEKVRNLREHGLGEGASTRLLIYAGRLMNEGISARRACQVAIVWTLSDEVELLAESKWEVVLLCDHDGMTHEQAADVLEIPVGTLKSRLHAGLTELRRRLLSEAT